jgi:eukaryotic-like serine/threonine-protein kinase
MKLIQPGITELAGYRITDMIGSGGMGNVYKAWHQGLQREAAIKILHQHSMADRFRNEAYIQSSVSHPNIARLYEYLPMEQLPCIIMEYVHGETLDTFLLRQGKLSNLQTSSIIAQIAAALAHLHAMDIVHRDIKPSNFKIQPDGTVKMLDFGIAKNKYTPKLTQLGFVVGTTEYMAPEQFHQQPEKKSDTWSLGVLAYELLTGYLPFDAHNPVTLRSKILKGEYTKPAVLVPGISSELQWLVQKCICVQTAGRMSAAGVVQLLAKHHSEPAAKTAALRFAWPPLFSRRPFAVAAVVLVSFFIILSFANSSSSYEGLADKDSVDANLPDSDINGNERKVKINTPSIDNAKIVFPNGESKTLPCEIRGRQGENIEFTIRASGYADKKVQVEINDRRSAYEYNLEKTKE